ncbi:hypothetical protein AVEN_162527-1 [Araneus ventricosus]|uniref:Uncharacterized protein n=1 Tax=Araneus ventricosus TaxID=182803 RepID=A0A4Y2I587_ARAVE|nr:hypothetical protein AVEN_162527-1 [Araneus ventricosus]
MEAFAKLDLILSLEKRIVAIRSLSFCWRVRQLRRYTAPPFLGIKKSQNKNFSVLEKVHLERGPRSREATVSAFPIVRVVASVFYPAPSCLLFPTGKGRRAKLLLRATLFFDEQVLTCDERLLAGSAVGSGSTLRTPSLKAVQRVWVFELVALSSNSGRARLVTGCLENDELG